MRRNKLLLCIMSFIFYLSAASFAAGQSADTPETKTAAPEQPVNYIAEGLKHRAEGRCDKAIENFKKAKKSNQFNEDWAFYHSTADCYTALKKYDEAINAYTKVIEASRNRALTAEMYRERAKAYYLKASIPQGIDKSFLALASKDLEEAKILGIDVSDMERIIAGDVKRKPLIEHAADAQKHALEIELILEKYDEIYGRLTARLEQFEKKLTAIKERQEFLESLVASLLQKDSKKKAAVKAKTKPKPAKKEQTEIHLQPKLINP
ncbi:MAG: hypothetical protein HY957_10260 [Nitrospirae bacterium]|nr:hypothetical protein [Nitrospirota bacterium]